MVEYAVCRSDQTWLSWDEWPVFLLSSQSGAKLSKLYLLLLHNVSFPYEFCGDLGKTLYFIFVRPELRSKESNFVFNFYLMRSKGSRRVQQYGSINDILWQLYIFGPSYAQISPNMFKRLPRSLNFQCLWRCFAQTNGILKRSQFSTQKLIIPHVC